MTNQELEITMDAIGTVLRDGGKSPVEIEELLHSEAVRVAEELKAQDEA